jgi:predicted nucleic acid-binding protein
VTRGRLFILDELGYLSLLDDFSEVLIPEQAWQEVEIHRPQALVNHNLSFQKIPVTISA